MLTNSFLKTFRSFLNPSIFLTLLLPLVLASVFWGIVLIIIWSGWSDFLLGTEALQWTQQKIGENFLFDSIRVFVLVLATLFVFGPLWYLTYLLILSLALFPVLLPIVQKKYYPNLEKKKGGSFVESLKNSLIGGFLFVTGFMLTLPLWLFTPLAPVLNLFMTAYLNKKVFVYDVFQDFASQEERTTIEKKYGNELWLVGLLSSLLVWFPILNLFAPGLAALAFIHYCLGRLQEMRNPSLN